MSDQIINVRVSRYDPTTDAAPRYQTYRVPSNAGMSILDVLSYIYEHVDHTLAFYDHASCHQNVCGRCWVVANGKPVLACQVAATEDLTLAPQKGVVVRDLVTRKAGKSDDSW